MFAKDKLLHFAGGIIVCAIVLLVTGVPVYGLAAGVFVGAAKEVYDSTGRGTVEFADFLATSAGAFVAMVLL